MVTSVAGVTSTLSKHPALFPENAPRRLVWASGSQVGDDQGRTFTDWISGLLAVTLGHNHPEVTEAVTKHLQDGGPTWSLAHPLEEEVASTILRLTGFDGGQVRFVKTGSEACSAAVRIARAVTGKRVVLSAGYHGWHDGLLATSPAWGVPTFPRGRVAKPGHPVRENMDLRTFASHSLEGASHAFWGLNPEDDGCYGTEEPGLGSTIACVIVEPVTADDPPPGYLQGLRDLCDKYGALLIFDEAITGGRYPEFTAGRHYGVQPDLTVLSKGLANGYPLACVVGKAEYMRCFDLDFQPDWAERFHNGIGWATDRSIGPTYVSGTWSGETVGLAAAKATLHVWERDQVAEYVDGVGKALALRLEEGIVGWEIVDVAIKGPPYRLLLDASNLLAKTYLMRGLLKRGHLIGAGFNPTFAHTLEDVRQVGDEWWRLCKMFKADAVQGQIAERAGRLVVAPYRQA